MKQVTLPGMEYICRKKTTKREEFLEIMDEIIPWDVDVTIINASSSAKNADKARDPEMHQTKKGNEWKFGMKCHIGMDVGKGLVHTITVTAANEHDIAQTAKLLREEDEIAYGDSSYLGV